MSLSFVANNGTTWDFDGSQGVTIVDQADGIFNIPVELLLDQHVSADGARLTNSRYAPRRLLLRFLLVHDTSVLATWGLLLRSFAAGGKFVYNGPNGVRELRYVTLESPDRSMTGQDLAYRADDAIAVSFQALDPWWYGELQNVSGLFDSPTPWNASIPWNSNIPWNGGASVEVFVAGDAPALPTVVVTGAADQVAFAVGGRGGWEIDATIASGDYVSVSSETGYYGPHRGPHGFYPAADSPIDWSLLREGSQLFELPPGPTSIVFSASGTDSNSAWSVYWHPRYLTP